MSTRPAQHSIAPNQPNSTASIQEWVDWFYASFLPAWIERARDPNGFGFYDLLDQHAHALQQNRRTVLAQARLLFTFSHLALESDNPVMHDAASRAKEALVAFQQSPGHYCRARAANKQATGTADDSLAMSYDQSFVILGLCTWGKLHANDTVENNKVEQELEACWSFIEANLTDRETGLLLEHDKLKHPSYPSSPPRAQNPHMHLYEAALQAYEMTEGAIWLERARQMRTKALEYFYDQTTGSIIEFIAPDLNWLNHPDGQQREIGHQCEWAWLLFREAELGGDATVCDTADTLFAFADQHGFAPNGVMRGAAYDAVSADKSGHEERFLLWPQTEAVKIFAIKKGVNGNADKARRLMLLVFQQYFANHAVFINQVDNTGKPLWPEALSRLLYHIVLALTEGTRAGLWKKPA